MNLWQRRLISQHTHRLCKCENGDEKHDDDDSERLITILTKSRDEYRMELTYIERTSHMLMFSLKTKVKVKAEFCCSPLFGKVHARIQEARDYLKLYHSFIDYWTLKKLFMFPLVRAFFRLQADLKRSDEIFLRGYFLGNESRQPWVVGWNDFWGDVLKGLELERGYSSMMC